MTDQTLPAGGGAYVREKDGTLKLIEEPTAPAPVGPPPEEPVEAAVEAAFTSRRTPVPAPKVKEA